MCGTACAALNAHSTEAPPLLNPGADVRCRLHDGLHDRLHDRLQAAAAWAAAERGSSIRGQLLVDRKDVQEGAGAAVLTQLRPLRAAVTALLGVAAQQQRRVELHAFLETLYEFAASITQMPVLGIEHVSKEQVPGGAAGRGAAGRRAESVVCAASRACQRWRHR